MLVTSRPARTIEQNSSLPSLSLKSRREPSVSLGRRRCSSSVKPVFSPPDQSPARSTRYGVPSGYNFTPGSETFATSEVVAVSNTPTARITTTMEICFVLGPRRCGAAGCPAGSTAAGGVVVADDSLMKLFPSGCRRKPIVIQPLVRRRWRRIQPVLEHAAKWKIQQQSDEYHHRESYWKEDKPRPLVVNLRGRFLTVYLGHQRDRDHPRQIAEHCQRHGA